MQKLRYRLVVLFFSLSCYNLMAQSKVFKVIPLGVEGGLNESNLSAYLLGVKGQPGYIALDAGTIYSGIEKAIHTKVLQNTSVSAVLQDSIKGYCISHAHLDHVAGLIINSPNDSKKNIYAMPYCLQVLENNYFTWQSWANFGDAGSPPLLNKYHYVSLQAQQEVALAGTNMFVTPFVLSHGSNYQSTAFLVRYSNNYVLYLGDTGADTIEHSSHLKELWQSVAPLVKKQQLKAIFIEVSYSNKQPETQLFGHLTPKLLLQEMQVLHGFTGNDALKKVKIIVTHIKPEKNVATIIQKELMQNNMQLQFQLAQQAKPIYF